MQSLLDLCLLTVRNGVEEGAIANVDNLPLELRRAVLDWVRNHGELNNENCVRCFGRPAFLDGFRSFDLMPDYDSVWRLYPNNRREKPTFLNLLQRRFSRCVSLASTVGSLNLCLCCDPGQPSGQPPASYLAVCQLLKHCPSLRSLSLIGDDNWSNYEPTFSVPDGLGQALRTADCPGLTELRLSNMRCVERFETESSPLFRSLKRLALTFVFLTPDGWRDILRSCRRTLVDIQLDMMLLTDDCPLFPVELANLTSVSVECNAVSVSELFANCSKLRQGSVFCSSGSISASDVSAMSSMSQLRVRAEPENGVVSPLFWRLVERAGSNLFDMTVRGTGDHLPNRLADDILTQCTNLTSLRLHVDEDNDNNSCRHCNRFLGAFLGCERRAGRLRLLQFDGPLRPEVADLLFRRCTNLDQLHLYSARFPDRPLRLTDRQLSDWTRVAAKPRHLCLSVVDGLGDATLAELLRHSGQVLQRLELNVATGSHNPRYLLDVMLTHCKNLKNVKLAGVAGMAAERRREIQRRMTFSVQISDC